MTKYCSQCGAEIPKDNKFCSECGFKLDSTNNSTIKTADLTNNSGDFFTYAGRDIDRTPEMILSVIGAVVGICLAAWIFYGAYVLGAVGAAFGAGLGAILSSTFVSFLIYGGVVCIIGAIISLIAGLKVRKNPKFYGFVLIIGSVCFILSFSLYGILPLVLVAVAGIYYLHVFSSNLTKTTEKNIDMIKNIIEASSNKSDLVLDCFAGSGTTLLAAQELDRNWIGIDNSSKAIEVIKKRLGNYVDSFNFYKEEKK